MITALSVAVARRLESGGRGALFATAWGSLASTRWRPRTPPATRPRIVAVSGSRLGGSQATPTVLSLALALSARGAEVALVTRAFGATVRGARGVSEDDDPRAVGDEALWLARACSGRVFVASRLEEGVALASQGAEVVVVDGRVAAHSRVLCHDPEGPAACPPAGDLRAPLETMRAWATHERDARAASIRVKVPVVRGRALLATAVARPHRLAAALVDVDVVHHLAYPDHGGPGFATAVARALVGRRVDVVLCTEKCASWLPPRVAGVPVEAIVARAVLHDALLDSL